MMTPDQDLEFTLLSCQAGEILVTQMSATVNENARLVIDNILGLLNWWLGDDLWHEPGGPTSRRRL